MSRFCDYAQLIQVTSSQDEYGNPIEASVSTLVFANIYKISTSTWLSARNAGLNADAEIEVRSCEYSGQERVKMGDGANAVTYDVERSSNTGEFTRLTLAKRVSSNG